MRIDPKQQMLLEDFYHRTTERQGRDLKAERVLEFHALVVRSGYRFEIPLHGKNMAQLVHPYWGYLGQLRGKEYSF